MPGNAAQEVGPRGDRSCKRSEDYSGPYRVRPESTRVRADVAAGVYGPLVRDALLDDLDSHQRDAVTSAAAPLAIIAPAGSGKTRVLTRRIAFGAREDRLVPRHVL